MQQTILFPNFDYKGRLKTWGSCLPLVITHCSQLKAPHKAVTEVSNNLNRWKRPRALFLFASILAPQGENGGYSLTLGFCLASSQCVSPAYPVGPLWWCIHTFTGLSCCSSPTRTPATPQRPATSGLSWGAFCYSFLSLSGLKMIIPNIVKMVISLFLKTDTKL